MVDYYATLEIARGATDTEIKKAYRKLAMKWHPDKNPDQAEEAAARFQELGEAYEVLTDKEKRAVYDAHGYDALVNGAPDGAAGGGGGYVYKQNGKEIFEAFFGTSNPFDAMGFGDAAPFESRLNKEAPTKPPAVLHDLACTLEELYNGCTKRVRVTRQRFPAGAAPEADTQPETVTLTINVQPGWRAGTKVTFPGAGDEAPGSLAPDLVFVIQEAAHTRFTREKANLVYTAHISLADALTECALSVPMLDGRTLSLPCPEVVSPGYEKVIPSEGMPVSKSPGQRGDMLVRFNIIFPKYLPDDRKIKLRALLSGTEPGAEEEEAAPVADIAEEE